MLRCLRNRWWLLKRVEVNHEITSRHDSELVDDLACDFLVCFVELLDSLTFIGCNEMAIRVSVNDDEYREVPLKIEYQ